MSIIKETLVKYKNNILIETGTYHGYTTKLALECGYNKIYSIELQERIYNIAKENLKNEIRDKKIELFLGQSYKILLELSKNIKEKCTFFLDAHIDFGNYDSSLTPSINWCPLIQEIQSINNFNVKNNTIIIDDLRILEKEGWGLEVKIQNLIDECLKINSNYKYFFEYDNLIFVDEI